jgi:uncharacterized membrane protein
MLNLEKRSTGDLLVLMIAFTICFSVLASGAAIVIAGILNPDSPHTAGVSLVTNVLQMLISLLAGFLAGRTDSNLIKQSEKAYGPSKQND